MRSAIAIIAVICGLAAANPVPRYRPKPPPQVAAGEWDLMWAGSGPWPMTLRADGTTRLLYGYDKREYLGSWHWDARSRTLYVTDTHDGGLEWGDWRIEFRSDELKGRGAQGPSVDIMAELRRRP